ncbi:MAG TPA: tagaturonate epimerase family protein [Chloroflexota bacterium]|nr:tagaturonate epimerase family protein [Chloroflexota bacterium]
MGLRPSVLGLRTAVGLGDRLGLAPLPAQQSIREISRTGRSPQQVMDDAMWSVFAEGWHADFGADADHLTTPADVDRCLAAGYPFYTFDPGQHVDNAAESAPAHELRARLDRLPWERLEDTSAVLPARYPSKPFECEDHVIRFDEPVIAWIVRDVHHTETEIAER